MPTSKEVRVDRSGNRCPYRPDDDRPPGDRRHGLAAIATAPAAWCPALSPDGGQVAYVTDRSGGPRLEVADLPGTAPPSVVSLPGQEVVSASGMSDLRTFFSGTEPWMAAASVTEHGDPATDADLLAALSPMSALDRVTAPVLLAHGRCDTDVPVGESVRAAEALRARGLPCELLLLTGEGHTIVGHESVAECCRRVAGWFDRWL